MGKSPARLKIAQAIGPACSSGYIRNRSKFKGVKTTFCAISTGHVATNKEAK